MARSEIRVTLARSENRVTIDRPLSEVFSIYTQLDIWRRTCVGSVRWMRGKPWEVESCLRIEPENADGVVVDQVLTQFEPNRFVSFISHFLGMTMQSQVHFRALADNRTEIETQLEFVGGFSRIASFPLRSAIERGTQQVFEDFKRECERTSAPQTHFRTIGNEG